MEEKIILRVTANYRMPKKSKEKNIPGKFDFIGFSASLLERKEQGKKSSKPEEDLEWTSGINRTSFGDNTLEHIAVGVLSYDKYKDMDHPIYELFPWEGEWPRDKERNYEGGFLLTTIPKQSDVNELRSLFNEYYGLKELISEKRYDELFKSERNNLIFSEAIRSIPGEDIIEYYIQLREKDKRKAAAWQKKYFPLFQYSELEMHYLHHLEEKMAGEDSPRK